MQARRLCAIALILVTAGAAHAQDGAVMTYAYAREAGYVPLESWTEDAVRMPAPLARRVHLKLHDVTLQKALFEIASQTGLGLSYGEDLVGDHILVSLKADGLSAADALATVTRNSRWVVLVNGAGQVAVVRQEPAPERREPVVGSVFGRVTDASTGAGISGASVMLQGTGQGTATANSGEYRISDVPAGTYTLVAQQLGYSDGRQPITVGDGQAVTADFALEISALSMEGLVVTGSLTPTALKAVSHPITFVTASDIEQLNVRDLDDIIRLTVPGVLAYAPGAGGPSAQYPASSSGFSFRGSTQPDCWSCSDVKIFIDGIEISDNNYIVNIEADQIERIEAVRGPQASAIYGSDALGGVIQIFTKRGQADQRPDLSFAAELGWLDRIFESGGTLKQDYTASISGGTAGATYRLGASYSKVGPFVPDYMDEQSGVHAAVRLTQGRLQADLLVRVNQSTTDWAYNPDLAALAAGTPYVSTHGPSNKRSDYLLQAYAAKVGFQATPQWRHELTAGFDGTRNETYKKAPTFYTAADSLLEWFQADQARRSFTYRTTMAVPIGAAHEVTVTAGADHYSYRNLYPTTTEALTTKPLTVADGAKITVGENTSENTGVYGQVQLALGGSVFLNSSIRAERRTMDGYGGDKWPLVSKIGATYARTVGSNTYKVRASYGSSIRQDHILGKHGSQFITVPGYGTLTIEPNPDLKPERQDGYDLGFDATFGDRGSINLTYYNQEMKDFSQAILLAPYPNAIFRYENIALVRNEGWEIEGRLNFGSVALRGNFAVTSSKPEALGPIAPQAGREVGKQLWFIPKNSAALAVTTTPLGRTTVTASLSYQGEMFGRDYVTYYECRAANSPDYCPSGSYTGSNEFWVDLPAVTTVNISAGHEFHRSLTAYIKVDDLTNGRREFPGSSNNLYLGRTIAVGVRARY